MTPHPLHPPIATYLVCVVPQLQSHGVKRRESWLLQRSPPAVVQQHTICMLVCWPNLLEGGGKEEVGRRKVLLQDTVPFRGCEASQKAIACTPVLDGFGTGGSLRILPQASVAAPTNSSCMPQALCNLGHARTVPCCQRVLEPSYLPVSCLTLPS